MTQTEEIQKELEDCNTAFETHPEAKSSWCCHHSELWELLTESYKNRIAFILDRKPKNEQAVRLRNFRPCTNHDGVAAIYAKRLEELNAIDAKWREELNPIYAKRQEELNPIHAKWLEELLSLYKVDVPQGTWNGKDIF